ncbi:DUF4952 domain-containing protein [Pseudomonas sp. TH08]|uniref:DUF4952 domain-containing protein n=1 Tax=unclassified Pseudomonas TaxID=196821 RepID=UPI0019148BDF|nr:MULTISPECIES: DUF4952 domain-containing protein [unclassified Pseudomonas]MBK5527360.1 DUF4952 domain-containing protein [Pseudomonas sp. TH06]MBK5531387.1 DUF4952 domain-containing protein [Pseudomonas sp. TH08]
MNRLIGGLVFAGLSTFAGNAMAEQQCGDFLAKLSDKPGFVEFLECTQDNKQLGKPLNARYRVKGSDALKAERYMSRSFAMPELRHICCGWDSTFFSYRDKNTQRWYLLGMGSEETLINRRESWSEITFFYINVSVTTEDF